MKIIALLDLDYFFAQCEIIRNPVLRDKPVVIIMPTVRENVGVVAAANYPARELKIRSGMSLSLAKKISSDETIFIKADMEYYKEISEKVFLTISLFVERIEQVSIDEAYLDLSNPHGFEESKKLCEKLKERLKNDFNLTCSIGISTNKLVAKMASNINKPNGLTIIKNEEIEDFFKDLNVKKLHGLGPKAAEQLEKEGVKTISDFKQISLKKLIDLFGNAKGKQYFDFSRGIDDREINENKEKQQLSRLMTLKKDSLKIDEILPVLDFLCYLVFKEITKINKSFRTISLIIVTSKFENITRSKTVNFSVSLEDLKLIEKELLEGYIHESLSTIRRIGVRVSNFDVGGYQKKLFDF